LDIELDYFDHNLGYQTITSPTIEQVVERLAMFNNISQRTLMLRLPYGTIFLHCTSNNQRFTLTIIENDDDFPNGTLMDFSQDENEMLDIRLNNGEVDTVSSRETVTKATVATVILYLLQNNRFPDDLDWTSDYR
jgi:hypothetical protein